MSNNPCQAFKNTYCDGCEEEIPKGDDVFFHEGDRYCGECAESEGIICDCGQYKKPEYETCYECKMEENN